MMQLIKDPMSLFLTSKRPSVHPFFTPKRLPDGSVGERQAARHRRQGLHNTVVNGFEIMQTLPSRERTPS